MSEDPLQALIVDASEMDRQRIADALSGVAGVDKSGRVIPLPGFQGLTARQKILAFLLGRHVAVLLNFADEQVIGPSALSRQTGMPHGTVYPTIRDLHEDRLVSQDADNGYYLAPFQIATAIDALVGEEEADSRARPSRRKKKPRTTTTKKQTDGSPSSSSSRGGTAEKREKRKSNGSGFSPTKAVKDLIEEGFFQQPRLLSDVQTRLKDKQGREVAVTTLAPIFTRLLRQGLVKRERNAEGTYAYTAPEA